MPSRHIIERELFQPDWSNVLSVVENRRPARLPLEDLIGLGIDAKHSNEDQIAPFEKWIELYGSRIGLFGGIDVDTVCTHSPDDVYREVLEKGTRFRRLGKGYGLGTGNSIPGYVPVEGFMALVEAAKTIRREEIAG